MSQLATNTRTLARNVEGKVSPIAIGGLVLLADALRTNRVQGSDNVILQIR